MFKQNLNFLRMVLIGLIISLMAINVSCTAPKTKGAYLDEFETFMENVEKNYQNFNNRQWEKYDEKYKKFTGEWQNKFQNEFNYYDEAKIIKYEIQYNSYKIKSSVLDLIEISNDDFETFNQEVKNKVKYYIENDLEDDLDIFLEEASKVSDTLVIIINQTIEDYNQQK